MSKDIALFRDYFTLVKPDKEEVSKWNDSIMTQPVNSYSADNNTQKGLEVTFEATHSGFFNDNLRFYLPSRMKDGAKSFVNRNKPAKILKHHDAQADPVGIILDAEYVETIPEGLENNKDVLIMMDSSNSVTKQVAAAKRFMKTGIPFSEGWRGLGYIKLKGILLDEEAIKQVNTGLFDAVSTSFTSPGQAYCSECQQNWAKDGFCEHEMGETYGDEGEETICALIPGDHNYKECSLVVFDGDPITQITIGHQDSLKEFSVDMKDWQNGSNEKTSNVAYSFRDYKEENTMADKTVQEDLAANQDEFISDEGMQAELKAMLDEEIITKEEWEAADAKLSTEQRKKLSASTFCGPDRSFPVPDCAHVTAALRLIGRYEGPGDKSKILNCVKSKAKALGCGEKKDETVIPEEETVADKLEVPTCDMIGSLDDKETRELFNMMESEMIIRNLKLDRPCGKCATQEDKAKNAEAALVDAEVKVSELENTLTVLRSELRNQMSDYMAQVDRYVELGTELTAAKKDHLALVGTLRGKFETIDKAMDSLSTADLTKEQAVIMEDFKLEDVMSKMNDGMANEPTGIVEDPTVNKDIDNNQIPDGLSPAALSVIENIRDFVKSDKLANAKQLYGKMVMLKVLDEKLVSFESLSASSKPATAE